MKTVTKVFLLIGTLMVILIVWQVFFNEGGVIRTGYNAVVTPINNIWSKATGSPDSVLIPAWDDIQVNVEDGVDSW